MRLTAKTGGHSLLTLFADGAAAGSAVQWWTTAPSIVLPIVAISLT